jgi:hypothetical protein
VIEIFRRFNALSTPFYTPSVAHGNFRVETIPANSKTQTFVDFDENYVISFLIEIFRRLNGLSTPFYTPSVAHGNFRVETIPANSKTQTFVDFDENYVISYLIEIFRRLNALSTPFYSPNVVHANFSVETITVNRKTQSFIFRRKLCYFFPDCDISAFKWSFHSILHAELSARQFQCQINPCKPQNAKFQISVKTLLFRS